MKRLPLIALLLATSFSVSACSSGFDKYNPFKGDDAAKPAATAEAPKEGDEAATTAPAAAPSAPVNLAAAQQEQEEMEAVMGNDAPRRAAPAPAAQTPAPAAAPVEAVKQEEPARQAEPEKTAKAAEPAPAPAREAAPAAAPAPSKTASSSGEPDGCPAVEVLPDTKSITYFEDKGGPMTARAVLEDVRGGCEYRNGQVEVDIDMIMQGRIAKEGRFEGRQDLEAFMTFPYFVAVIDPDGKMIDKKIMATAMRFQPNIDDLDHAEKITQVIPLTDMSKGSSYTITLGFQLNREQLDYNRANVVNRVGKEKAVSSTAAKTNISEPEKASPAPARVSAPEASQPAASAPAAPAAAATGSRAKMQPIVE